MPVENKKSTELEQQIDSLETETNRANAILSRVRDLKIKLVGEESQKTGAQSDPVCATSDSLLPSMSRQLSRLQGITDETISVLNDLESII